MQEEKVSILGELAQLQIADYKSFVLQNPLSLSPEMLTWAANQLQFQEKISKKIATWTAVNGLESPPKVSIEQASSERTAAFKAQLIKGKTCLDLTMGMGVDAFFFAQSFESVTAIEQNDVLAEINRFNFRKLGVNNVEILSQTAESFLENTTQYFDLIYLDPARRDENNQRVFFIEDCTPNVVGLLPELQRRTKHLLIKYAPMLDIKTAISTLVNVAKVIVLAVENDVKEVLYHVDYQSVNPIIQTFNILKSEQQFFDFTYDEESNTVSDIGEPQRYLYEPNAAIMKAGAFKSIAKRFGVRKLAQNTHLYTSDVFVEDFPGRSFEIQEKMKFDKKQLAKRLKNAYANISCRNFPLKPEQLKKILGYQDGGDSYLFFIQNYLNEKNVLFTKKVKT